MHYVLSSPASQLLVREWGKADTKAHVQTGVSLAQGPTSGCPPAPSLYVHPGLHWRPPLREGAGPRGLLAPASRIPLSPGLCLWLQRRGKCSHPSWPCRQGPAVRKETQRTAQLHTRVPERPRGNRVGAASVTAQAPISPRDTAIPRRPCSSLGAAEPGAAPARAGLGSARRIALWNT